MLKFIRNLFLFALTPLPLLAVAQTPASSSITADPKTAVETVTNLFTPSPVANLESTGKPLPTTGSWGVQMTIPATNVPATCQGPQSACVRVLYRVPEAGVVCNWIVAFVRGQMPGADGKLVAVIHPAIVDEDESAARYTVKKAWMPGDAPGTVQQRVPAIYSTIARDAHAAGVVHVEVIVGPSGAVASAVGKDGPPMLRVSASDAAKQWRFAPLTVGSHPISYRTELTFRFASGTSALADMGNGGAMYVPATRPDRLTTGAVIASPTGVVTLSCTLAQGCEPSKPH